ncbi:MAG: alpha/beta fold hydrolase [Clostridia bacterium]|nr:alpha/beta fold hydrolase [Clostridia bacterium]
MQTEYFDIQTERYSISCKLYVSGQPVRGIILGVHGLAGDKESSALRALASCCADKGVSLLCFDFPAHGSSEAKEDDLTVANCISDLYEAADWCRKKYPDAQKYLFATSFGGYVALLCSHMLNDFSIVLRAPAVTMAEHVLTDLLHTSPEEYKKQGVISCGFERKIDLPYSFYQELQAHQVSGCAHGRPMLIIHGSNDDVVPLDDVVSFCDAHRDAVLKIIEGADHRFKKPGEIERVVKMALDHWGIPSDA